VVGTVFVAVSMAAMLESSAGGFAPEISHCTIDDERQASLPPVM
jgi:hypothetical protein